MAKKTSGRSVLTATESTSPSDHDWYRSRSYAHFDRPLSRARAENLVTTPEKVARHSFWPLILNPKRVVSLRSNVTGSRQRHIKLRPIAFAAHSDSHIFSYYARILTSRLEEEYEGIGETFALAYRRFAPPRCNLHFAQSAFEEISREAPKDVIAIDVEAFFDSIDHSLLKTAWRKLLGVDRLPSDHFAVLHACTRDYAIDLPRLREALGGEVRRRAGKGGYPICDPAKFRENVVPRIQPRHQLVQLLKKKEIDDGDPHLGIPQGLPISAVLANLYMLDADKILVSKISALGGTYRRYSDDILVIIDPDHSRQAEEFVYKELGKVHLSANKKKTRRHRFSVLENRLCCRALDEERNEHSESAVSYLGLTFDGSRTAIRDSTVSRFLKKAKSAIRNAERTARRQGAERLKRRKLYTRLTTLGYGSAYGTMSSNNPRSADVPRPGFFKYVALAIRVTKSESIRKQQRQIKNQVFRWLSEADKRLAEHAPG
ncbi:MAG: hypothetical protein KDD11_18410 [Acidobacteria bacterium]|nr:hypothetical protein [Acidobacteriota bacterium]